MNDAGFGVFLVNLGRHNEGETVGRWYGLEDFPLTYDRVARDIELDETHEGYFVTDWQGCPQDMGEYTSLDSLNGIAKWISDQVDEGFSEEDVCTLLSKGAIGLFEIVDGVVELRFYGGMHTMAEVAQCIWNDCCEEHQDFFDSLGYAADFITFDAEAFGSLLETKCRYVDTKAGIFEIVR